MLRLCGAMFVVMLGSSVHADNEITRIFNQTLDHFNSENKGGPWQQRYYVNTTFFRKPKAGEAPPPLFFIPGGEWSVTPTKGVLYGMAHELAEQHGGLMAIAEHRFYGESLPFKTVEESFIASSDRIGLLSVEQAMADYADIITHILEEHDCTGASVVALGGSYSGKLSAYMRLKYPFIVTMALSASAPIYLDSVGLTDKEAYYNVVEKASLKISPQCPAAVKASFAAYRAAPVADRKQALGLCSDVAAAEYGYDELEFYIIQYFATMAMFNYPPTTSMLLRACNHVLGTDNGNDIFNPPPAAAAAVTSTTSAVAPGLAGFNRLLKALTPVNGTCFNLTMQAAGDVPSGGGSSGAAATGSAGTVACSDWSGCGSQQGGLAWDYQACTQVTQPLSVKENSTMFPPHEWTEEWMEEHCMRRFGIKPKFEHMRDTYGLTDITRWPQPAHIIFSNGLQDPWHAGGVLKNATETMVAITIPNGAHHQDLNGGHAPNDTPDMLEARAREKSILAAWLKDVGGAATKRAATKKAV